jgi:hypothetical protein
MSNKLIAVITTSLTRFKRWESNHKGNFALIRKKSDVIGLEFNDLIELHPVSHSTRHHRELVELVKQRIK